LAVAAYCVGYNVFTIKYEIAGRIDGPGTFNPVGAASVSLAFLILALVLGLLLKIPPVSRAWTRDRRWVVLTLCVSLVWFVFAGFDVGWGYLGLLFAIANWPLRDRGADGAEAVESIE